MVDPGHKGKIVLAGLLGLVCAALYPLAYLPLASRHIKDEQEALPGFSKKGRLRMSEPTPIPPASSTGMLGPDFVLCLSSA